MLLVLIALLAAQPALEPSPPPVSEVKVFGLTGGQITVGLTAIFAAGIAAWDRRKQAEAAKKALSQVSTTTGVISERVANSQTDVIREMIAPIQVAAMSAATAAAGARSATDRLETTVTKGQAETGHRLDTIDTTLKDHGARLGRLESGQQSAAATAEADKLAS
jgi:hypothetical protein